jgi:hypothetical protein
MNQRVQTLLTFSILLIGFVAFWRMQTALAWGIIPAILAVPWMLGDPKRLLAGYWVWATICEYAYQITRIGAVRYGDEALLGCIVIAMVFQHALNRASYPDVRAMTRVFTGLVILFILSFAVNRGSYIDAAVTTVQYLRPFVLGFFAYAALKPQDLPSVAKFFILTLLIQLVMNVAWLLGINPLPHPGIYVGIDFAVGTMGTSLFVGYTACLGIALCVAIFLVFGYPTYLLLSAVLTASLLVTNTAHAYAFLGVMLLIIGLLYSKGTPMRILGITFAVIPLLAIITLVQVLSPNTLKLDSYLRRGSDLFTGRKMEAYRSHLVDLPQEPSIPFFLLGTGPGSLGTTLADERGYLAAKYHGWTFTGTDALEVQTRSIIMHTKTGFLAIWSDLGPIAFLLYWGSHFYALLRVTSHYRKSRYNLPWQRAFALSFPGVMTLYLLVAFMTDVVHTALWGCVPWIWASFVWTPQEAPETAPDEVIDEEELQPDSTKLNPILSLR